MRTFRPLLCCLPLAALAAQLPASAQDIDEPVLSGWYMRVGGAARFNVKATITPVAQPLAAGNYADGFVLPDIGGSTNFTWNWGFNSSSQVDATHTQLDFYRYDNLPSVSPVDVPVSGPLWGGEIIGGYKLPDFKIAKKPARFGIELGYSYSSFSEGVDARAFGAASYSTAAYNYGGIILPVPPYAGTLAGPGPLIQLNPDTASTTTDLPGTTVTTLQGSLKSTFHEMRFGPMLEVDLSRKFTVGVGAGYSSVYADAELNYEQAVAFGSAAIPSLAPVRGSVSEAKWRPGLYAEARVAYRFSDRVNAFLGGDIHYNNKMTFGDSNYSVKLDLGMTYGAKAGVSYSF